MHIMEGHGVTWMWNKSLLHSHYVTIMSHLNGISMLMLYLIWTVMDILDKSLQINKVSSFPSKDANSYETVKLMEKNKTPDIKM